MQGKIFAIPYAAWIAAFVFDVLIIIDSYPAALLLFLLLSYHSYKKFFLKQAGTYKILICLGGEIFLSLLCILTISTLNHPLSTDQTTLLFFHPAACCILSVSAYLIHKTFKTMDHSLLKIVKYRYLTESKAADKKRSCITNSYTLIEAKNSIRL